MFNQEENYWFVLDQLKRNESGWVTLSKKEILDFAEQYKLLYKEGDDGWKHLEESK